MSERKVLSCCYAFVAKCLKLLVLAAMKIVRLYDIKFSCYERLMFPNIYMYKIFIHIYIFCFSYFS